MSLGFRTIEGLIKAERSGKIYPLAKPQGYGKRKGLTYERKVKKELLKYVEIKFEALEHNPWFYFIDKFGRNYCCPDFLIHLKEFIIIVEVKLTYVEEAREKLEKLYKPVVEESLQRPTKPLVICRNLTEGLKLKPKFTLTDALNSDEKLLLYPENGPLVW